MPKLNSISITDAIARNAKPKDRRYDIFDSRTRSMGLRVEKSGTKSWFVMRRVRGRMVRKTIGRYPDVALADARVEASRIIAELVRGEDGEQNQSSQFFGAALDEWLTRDQGKNRTVRQVRNAMDLYVRPVLAKRKLDDVTKSDINRIIDEISDRGAGVQANRVLTYLRRFFNWCIGRDLLGSNPTTGIPKPHQETSRERVLSISELEQIDQAAQTMGYPFGPLFRMLLLTGQRRDEVGQAVWDEFDLEGCKWTIPGSRSKNGRSHIVHLSAPVVELLGQLPRVDGHTHLFTTNGLRPVSGFSTAKRRLDGLCGVAGWTLHDLRRSFASHTTEHLGISPVVIDKILNHQSGAVRGVAAIYQRGAYLDQRRAALEDWARYMGCGQDLGHGHLGRLGQP